MSEEEKNAAENGSAEMTVADKGLSQALGDLLVRLLGSLADEVGGDLVRGYSAMKSANLLKILGKAVDKAAAIAGGVRVRLSLTVLVPMLEKASLEEDAFMQEKWASLLAASVTPSMAGKMRKSFSHIFSQLDPLEVKILDSFYGSSPTEADYQQFLQSHGIGKDSYMISCRILMKEGLLRERHSVRTVGGGVGGLVHASYGPDGLSITELGQAFVECCRA